MDKNSVIGLTLIFIIFAIYFWFIKPSNYNKSPNQYNDTATVADNVNNENLLLTKEAQDMNNQQDSSTYSMSSNSAQTAKNKNLYGAFTISSNDEEQFYYVKTSKLDIVFSSLGGKIYSITLPEYKTFDSLPLLMFGGHNNVFGLSFFSNNRLINTDKLYFMPSDSLTETIIVGEAGYDFSMRLYAEENGTKNINKYIEYKYHIPYDDYMIDISCNIVGMNDVIYASNGFIDLSWSMDLQQQEKNQVNRLNGTTIYYQYDGDDASKLSDNKDGEKELSVKTRWISYKQQFFSSTLIASGEECFISGNIKSNTDANKKQLNDRYVKTMSSQLTIPYSGGDSDTFDMKMFFGPNKYSVLNQYDLGLDRQINIGNFFLIRWINRGIMFVFNFLDRFNWNYGIVILVLTILLKLILSPITYKSYLGNAKMRALKPETDAIAAKYPNQDDAMKKQQAMMEMYRKYGVSPMAGCLPLLLQFPILVAMFRFFPISFELRQQSFLWAKDLSTYDSILDLPFNIPFYGDHVSLFTLLMTASTIIYTIMNNKSMGQQSQPGMKFMTYFMPILFLGIFNSYSAGLSYYYLLFNLLSFAQTFIIGKIMTTEKLRAQLMLNAAKKDSKPKKTKSRWQKKLEELEKMRREQIKQNSKRR